MNTQGRRAICGLSLRRRRRTQIAQGLWMARDEARHGKAFAGLLKRYFGK